MSTNTFFPLLKKNLESISYCMTLLLAFFMAWPDSWLIKVFFCWAVSMFFDILFNKKYLSFTYKKKYLALYAMAFLYLGMLISLFYTHNLSYAGKILIRRIAFVIVPLIVSLQGNKHYRIKPLLFSFVLGAALSMLVVLLIPVFDYLTNASIRNKIHFYPQKTFFTLINDYKHRTFFCINQIIALLTVLYLKKELMKAWGKKCFWLFFLLYLFTFSALMLLSGSRIAIIIFSVVLAVYLIGYIWKAKYKGYYIVGITTSVLLIILVFFLFHPRFQSLHKRINIEQADFQELDPRVGIWYSAVEVLKNDHNYLLGVGIGDTKDLLHDQYVKNKLSVEEISKRAHTHNTYLQTWIEMGIPALLLLLFILLTPMFQARKGRAKVFTVCIVSIFGILMMVEAVFLQIGGLILFVMTWSVLPLLSDSDNDILRLPARSRKMILLLISLAAAVMLLIVCYPCYGTVGYDPKDPRTYAVGAYDLVSAYPGEVPEELSGSMGYKITSDFEGLYLKQEDRTDFVTGFYSHNQTDTTFSVWCYVSDDFNGSMVHIRTASPYAKMAFSDFYDLNKKASWQKLSITFHHLDEDIPVSLYFVQEGVRNFDNLQGYVIYALPQFE